MLNLNARQAQRIELLAAASLSIILLGAHLVHLFYAGPLWRDEVSSLNFATQPSWSAFWNNLSFDVSPSLFFLTLRGWHALVGSGDFQLRILGCIIGILMVCAFWTNAYLTGRKTPILSLGLFGFCPTVILWGDTLRGYGLGISAVILCFALFWRLIEHPGPWEILFALLAAVASVQSVYPNALLVFACGMAAVAVAVRRGHWGRAAIVLLVGALAAISLLPYAQFLHRASTWASLYRIGFSIPNSLNVLSAALLGRGGVLFWAWVVLALLALIAAIFLQSWSTERRDHALYASLAAIIGFVSIMTYFRIVGWGTNVWYYLPLLALLSVSIDLLCDFPRWLRGTALSRAGLAVIIVVGSFPALYTAVSTRLSNYDLVADIIAKRAVVGDLVIIDPFVDALTFTHYYHGPVEWIIFPPVPVPSVGPDDIPDALRRPDAVVSGLDKIKQTLQAGRKVWLATSWNWDPPTQPPALVAPLRPSDNRTMGYFLRSWQRAFQYLLSVHAESSYLVPVPCDQPIAWYEKSRLYLFSGWRSKPEQTSSE
jgi:hypothetical protein